MTTIRKKQKAFMTTERIALTVVLLVQVYMAYHWRETSHRQLELSKITAQSATVCVDSVKIVTKAAQDALAMIRKEEQP
jgi:hypothetical protein